jgi:helicase MOV-10
MTRAQALLIVVGDPNVLSIDPMWRGFLNYIHINKGWKGQRITWDPRETDESITAPGRNLAAERREWAQSEMDQLVERTREIVLRDGAGGAEVGESDLEEDMEGNVDRPWREGT